MSGQQTRVSRSRQLKLERLCQRQLLAGDMTNPANPLDVNNNGEVTAGDALVVINYIAEQQNLADGEQVGASRMFPDTNGDNNVTGADALRVLNDLIEGEHIPGHVGDRVDLPGLHVKLGKSIKIDFEGDNGFLTISSPQPGQLTFAANGGAETVSIQKDLIIESKGNGNRLVLNGAIIPRDLVVRVKGNDNAIRLINNTKIGDDFIYRGGKGEDGVFVDVGTEIRENLDINTRSGNDYIAVRGATVGDDLIIHTEKSWDFVAFDGVNVGDDAIVRMGKHNDYASVRNMNVGDVADISGNSDFDKLAADVNTISARKLKQRHFEAQDAFLNINGMIDRFF